MNFEVPITDVEWEDLREKVDSGDVKESELDSDELEAVQYSDYAEYVEVQHEGWVESQASADYEYAAYGPPDDPYDYPDTPKPEY